MPAPLTANEESQTLQVIEMFEVITQSQPLDYQSLEILKEAYAKLGRQSEALATSKRIASAYVQLGQLSSAILEYESILQRFPEDPDVLAALAEIESKANNVALPSPAETEWPEKPAPAAPKTLTAEAVREIDDGRAVLRKLFVDGKHISSTDFDQHWPAIHPNDTPRQPIAPLIHTLAEKQLFPIESSLKLICEKARLGFLPLDRYDVDIELARTFPRDICLRWCMLPFDRLSKSLLVATANPFNKQATQEMEDAAQSRLLWYVAPPAELIKILKKVFR